ncbi:MAG: Ppx/GppA phosphatase family protein [Candidatus Krumholzibacteria bacterium]|jgi:exopolyphosphatase/guanosine-5'-triphosphate,3'-diphosphate pyrophosphatase|nr:Ppx/GppA phosphatase family protein [Candidatus Krumholzibacteria bacterium]MDP6668371.1 Ppx/GppA phosphatase family protein [Candidatus Krumholzibacteria bacterium]MDP6797420.1 Ppx/GppA phosphatase family protein [Candidatus Krumholzibacteria bacterium]MDP7022175.1 Ppx/GppA phosphatase family protein [Candidatus Krumholzibacteria bacterium]
MSVKAVIDIGSNSVKLHVASLAGGWKVLRDSVKVCGLGEGLQESGRLGRKPMDRAATAVLGFVEEARNLGAGEIALVGTMALRSASNSQDFLSLVEGECGLKVEVISGEEEARLSYHAVVSGLGKQSGQVAIFDTGGGSTEFIYGEGGNVTRKFSLNVGSLRFTEKYCKSDPVTETELLRMLSSLSDEFSELESFAETLIGVGGTLSSLASVMHEMESYEPEIVQGTTLPYEEVERQLSLFRSLKIEERKMVPGLMPGRAPVILAGVSIVRTVMDKMKVDSLTVSDRSLRHGLFHDRWMGKETAG